jgi:hypothetical protein
MKTIARTAPMELNSYQVKDGVVTMYLSNRWTRTASEQVHAAVVTLPSSLLEGFDALRGMRATVTVEQADEGEES